MLGAAAHAETTATAISTQADAEQRSYGMKDVLWKIMVRFTPHRTH